MRLVRQVRAARDTPHERLPQSDASVTQLTERLKAEKDKLVVLWGKHAETIRDFRLLDKAMRR